ncbi:MAG: DUF4198 domain-containing protein [Hyphomicrobiales bacterium]|nr:DUF4198 domain-containing protein [Hyphomicrobiales bacterium]
MVRFVVNSGLRYALHATLLAFSLLALTAAIRPAAAHEFWLAPDDYTPRIGATVQISHRIGQFFKGNSYPFVRDWMQRYVIADAGGERALDGVDGDIPATKIAFARAGLTVVAYYSSADRLTFSSWRKFRDYLALEGLEHIAPLHRQKGKPETGIREIYFRCAKALLQVGGAGGVDRALGLPLELIAERNPYEVEPGETLPVRLLYNGMSLGGITIKLFSKADPENPHRVLTDAEGRAEISLATPGTYLLNAVHMVEPSAGEKADWKSYWASLTFRYGSSSVSQ